MSDIVTLIGGIALLIAILGGLPYTIWIIYSAYKKRWRKVCFQICVPAIFWLTLTLVYALAHYVDRARYFSDLFDTNVILGTPIYEFDSERAFNGDGYSISVYELPISIKKRFESADQHLLTNFPKHPSYRNHWNFEHWREAPFDNKFKEHLNFALSEFDSNPKLKTIFNSIRDSLLRRGTFYAFFYNSPSNHVGDIDFFVIDLTKNRLYMINFNT